MLFLGFFEKNGKKIKNQKIEDDQLLGTDITLLLRYHSKKSVENPRRSINLKKNQKHFFLKNIFFYDVIMQSKKNSLNTRTCPKESVDT